MKGWKKYEQDLTAYLQSHTKWTTKRRSRAEMGEDVMDVQCGPLAVEAKCPKGRPQYLEDWLSQAEKNREGLTPIVVWHKAHESIDDDVVIMRLGDFVEFSYLSQKGAENWNKDNIRQDILDALEEIKEALEKL